MTLGRSAGTKTCDDCVEEYQGPAYRTFAAQDCVTSNHLGEPRPHPGCTGNLCPRCAKELLPDRPDDPRRPAARDRRGWTAEWISDRN